MSASGIRVFRPNVSQAEAVSLLSRRGLSSFLWRLRCGPLARIADVYVPFRIYRVRYRMNKAQHTRFFAMDAVDGSLDLFEFPAVPSDEKLIVLDTRNHLEPKLGLATGEEFLRSKVMRVLFQQGFFKLRDFSLEVTREPDEIHIPYWLGLYGGDGSLRCRALDAVRRRLEGAKASAFFEQWLAA